MGSTFTFTEPDYESDTVPFWAGVTERRFLVHRCSSCGRCAPAFSSSCAYCGAEPVEVVEADGYGELYSWTVCHRALDPAFEHDVPYTIAAVRLVEGAIVYGRLVGVPASDLYAGLSVEITWITTEPDARTSWAFTTRLSDST